MVIVGLGGCPDRTDADHPHDAQAGLPPAAIEKELTRSRERTFARLIAVEAARSGAGSSQLLRPLGRLAHRGRSIAEVEINPLRGLPRKGRACVIFSTLLLLTKKD